jgi:hypothetical protein
MLSRRSSNYTNEEKVKSSTFQACARVLVPEVDRAIRSCGMTMVFKTGLERRRGASLTTGGECMMYGMEIDVIYSKHERLVF